MQHGASVHIVATAATVMLTAWLLPDTPRSDAAIAVGIALGLAAVEHCIPVRSPLLICVLVSALAVADAAHDAPAVADASHDVAMSTRVNAVAFVVLVCKSNDRTRDAAEGEHVVWRARLLACTLNHGKGWKDFIALTCGLAIDEIRQLQAAGYRTVAVSDEQAAFVTLKPLYSKPEQLSSPSAHYRGRWRNSNCQPHQSLQPYSKTRVQPASTTWRRWPHRDSSCVQQRNDFACTSLKLLAWNMTEYDVVLMADTDNVFLADPLDWVHAHAHHYFVATHEIVSRGYEGINSHLMLLQPSRVLFQILAENARTGGFEPYTNSDQDVIEQVFGAHRDFPALPPHRHGKSPAPWDCGRPMSRRGLDESVQACLKLVCGG